MAEVTLGPGISEQRPAVSKGTEAVLEQVAGLEER